MKTERRWILDYLRLVLAADVVLSHYGFPVGRPGSAAHLVLGNLANGPAAVIVFFVISGFCIHAAHVGQPSVKFASYIARRDIRIGIPALVAVAFSLALKCYTIELQVLWSLWCEEIYYLLYPLILRVRARWGWPIIWASSITLFLAARLTSHNDPASNFYSAGWGKTWMLGLPCWILGCVMAEFVLNGGLAKMRSVSALGLWAARAGILVAAWASSLAHSHFGVSYMDALPIFGFVSAIWLLVEMKYTDGKSKQVPAFVGASFSLYLCHRFSGNLLTVTGWSAPVLALYAFAALFSLAFYFAVELPCHKLARSVSKKLA